MEIQKIFFENRQRVVRGEPILDLESSKITVTIESTHDGYIEYCVSEGNNSILQRMGINYTKSNRLKQQTELF